MRGFLFLSVLWLLLSCSQHKNKFEDATLQAIADWQDRRLSDSLLVTLHSSSVVYRAASALAFGSVQDTAVSPALGDLLLEDESDDVRASAAFALGQTGGVAAVNALIPAMVDHSPRVVREVLEALGKTVSASDLEMLSRYESTDTLIQEGLCWGYYRLGVRGMADSVVVARALEFLASPAVSVRKPAAQFFSRTRGVKITDGNNLRTASLSDRSAEVRMAAARGLRHLGLAEASDVVERILKHDADYRVRCNALRALAGFEQVQVQKMTFNALRDNDLNVRITASEQIRPDVGLMSDVRLIVKEETNWRVRANLYAVLLSGTVDSVLASEVVRAYNASTSDYEKAGLLNAMAGSGMFFSHILSQVDLSQAPVVRTAALQALVNLNQKPDLKSEGERFLGIYKQAVAIGDPVLVGIASSALVNPSLGFQKVVSDISFLREARARLKLPEDIETIRPVDRAIAYFEGVDFVPVSNEFNHPIDWLLVKQIDKNQKVLLKTSKGNIELRLLVEEAPGSVANFVQLIRDHYYDDKFVHRVVPNFVIQAGCKRGDGYGSEDYSIRSEFSMRRYREGAVGMASAGKDTEGTQWFITHSSTPHLDGNYTIFAEVVSGMDIVHGIEVGDKILSATLMDN